MKKIFLCVLVLIVGLTIIYCSGSGSSAFSAIPLEITTPIVSSDTIINYSFELGDTGWTNLTVGDYEYYAPVDGETYAVSESGGESTSQLTGITIQSGKSYTFTIWARSIYNNVHTIALKNVSLSNPAYPQGNTARARANFQLTVNGSVISETTVDVSPVALIGAPETNKNDDGANVWLDGNYRIQINDNTFYQTISSDPINDTWFCGSRNDLDMAVGQVITPQGLKAVYGTWYDASPASAISLYTTTNSAPNYRWTNTGVILEHSGNEVPWVIDAHLFYDENSAKLWMTWGGHQIYISELNPTTGKLISNPADPEYTTHPAGTHTKIMSFAEAINGAPANVPSNWEGDEWSSGYMEGAALYKHNNYYYALGTYGNLNINYNIRMGRSSSPTGPYSDKKGYYMTTYYAAINRYGASFLLGNDGNQLVPGHPHIWEENGVFYIGYDYRKNILPTADKFDYMGIRKLYWFNEWPTIWTPITITLNADDYPNLIGQKLGIVFKNSGETGSVVAFDSLALDIQ